MVETIKGGEKMTLKGVILAGGTGSRLQPLTNVTNKHLLPIYNKPMIYYPIETLKSAGIKDILVITGKDHAGDVFKLLGSGKDFGVNFTFKVQDEAGGLPQAIGLASDFAHDSKFVSINGDNILFESIKTAANEFESSEDQSKVLLYEGTKEEAMSAGVAVFDDDGKVTEVIEKPKNPPTNQIVIGVYFYTPDVFEIIKGLKPSARGELEIADIHNHYIKQGKLSATKLTKHWLDAGTIDELASVNTYIHKHSTELDGKE
ncbi:MAG: NTP transferase domain-containing protein [Candidatus Diapherotrites archaeon]|nr:NTP transferase domain-containing protein [Candidatus Diapherotrites archaeon]